MKKSILTLGAVLLLALGSLAISSEPAVTPEDCPPCKPPVCQPSDCCPIPCPQ